MQFSREHPQFLTATCLEWKPLLTSDDEKEIIIESFRYMTTHEWVHIMGFVLMSNHIHVIWQMIGDHRRENVQRDFLKYTSQRILEGLKKKNPSITEELRVDTSDRKFQVWERNSLAIELTTKKFLNQKLNYIHLNPVRAGLCKFPEDYKYSSARYYICNEKDWDFLVHHKG